MPSYRYPGPRPFEENDIDLFFGREKDKKSLLTFINVEQMLVVFSKSGLGKSSLINAAIIPELRKRNYEIILCRFNSYVSQKPGEEDSISALPTPLQKLFNEIAVNQLAPRLTAETTFLDNLKSNANFSLWHQFKNLQIYNQEKKTYFIFFDQFEELFTYPKEQVKEFKEHLAELLSASVPQEYLNAINKVESDTSSPDLADQQLDLLYDAVPVKILCTIRSDKFSLLTTLKDAIPGIVTKTYELKPFSSTEATEAIRKPASIENTIGDGFVSNSFSYDDEAITKMLNYLSDNGTEDIESFQLQVLCRYVEDIVVEGKNNGNLIINMTANQLGDIKNVFEAYYNKLIAGIDKDKVQNVKRLFEDGLIFEKDKIRVSLYEGQIESGYGVDESLLNKLVSTHLIRCEQDTNGKEKYELSHDSLIEPILKAKEIRVEEEKAKFQRTKFKKRVELFGGIAIGIFLIFAVLLYIFSRNAKSDGLKINFLVSEKDWFYLLAADQQKNVLKNDFLFLSGKDSIEYQNIKYSFKCAAYANLTSDTDYLLALKFANEGVIKNSNPVTQKSLDSLINRPGVSFASRKINCKGIIHNVKLTKDKRKIIAVTTQGIFWYDADSGVALDSLITSNHKSDYSVFSDNGTYLLYESFNGDTTFLLNTITKQLKPFANNYTTQPHSIAFDINDSFFVHGNSSNKLSVLSLNGDVKEEYTLPIYLSEKINELSISPNGEYVAAGTDKGSVFLIDRHTKAVEEMQMETESAAQTKLPVDSVNSVFKQTKAVQGTSGETDSAAPIQMQMHNEIVNSVSFSHYGEFVLTGSSDSNVDIWNVKTKRLVQTLKNHSAVLRCRFSDDDSSIFVGEKSDGEIVKWSKGGADSTNANQTKADKNNHVASFKKSNAQFIGLDSGITTINLYNNDALLIASSNHSIAIWNLNKKNTTVSEMMVANVLPALTLSDKVLWNIISENDIRHLINKQEIAKSIGVLNDSLRSLAATENTITANKQTFINYLNLIPKLYNQLKFCTEGELTKDDSFYVYLQVGDVYFYKMHLEKSKMNGMFNRHDLDSLIYFRQMPFKLDTFQVDNFHNLFDAYAPLMTYYFKNNWYDSLLYWNNKILNDNPELLHIDAIQNDLAIWYQYNVCFKLLSGDVAGAKKSFQQCKAYDNISYLMTNELLEIMTNPTHSFNEAKFKKTFTLYDLKDDYNQNNISDMDGVLIRLLDERLKLNLTTDEIDNISDFDDYIYQLIQ